MNARIGADEPGPPGSRASSRDRRTLSVGDPWESRAAEDRPESWGERSESDEDRLAHYEAQRPPHHGG